MHYRERLVSRARATLIVYRKNVYQLVERNTRPDCTNPRYKKKKKKEKKKKTIDKDNS